MMGSKHSADHCLHMAVFMIYPVLLSAELEMQVRAFQKGSSQVYGDISQAGGHRQSRSDGDEIPSWNYICYQSCIQLVPQTQRSAPEGV